MSKRIKLRIWRGDAKDGALKDVVDTSGYYVWYSSTDAALFILSKSSSYPRVKLELTGSFSSTGGSGFDFTSIPVDAVFKNLECDHEHYFTLSLS